MAGCIVVLTPSPFDTSHLHATFDAAAFD